MSGTRRDELVDFAREASSKGWWEAFSDLPDDLTELIGMEAEAMSAWDWEPQIIPGLSWRDRCPCLLGADHPSRVGLRLQPKRIFDGPKPQLAHRITLASTRRSTAVDRHGSIRPAEAVW